EAAETSGAIGHLDRQDLRSGAALEPELDPCRAALATGIAGDLGDGGGDARLIRCLKSKELGELTRPPAHPHDIVGRRHHGGRQEETHRAPSLTTTTVASSRPRPKSR